MDTGLAAFLTGWDSPKSLEAGAMNGAILETFVFGEMLKSYWHNGRHQSVYFYRDADQRKVDFLFERDGTLYPAEVKKNRRAGACRCEEFRRPRFSPQTRRPRSRHLPSRELHSVV